MRGEREACRCSHLMRMLSAWQIAESEPAAEVPKRKEDEKGGRMDRNTGGNRIDQEGQDRDRNRGPGWTRKGIRKGQERQEQTRWTATTGRSHEPALTRSQEPALTRSQEPALSQPGAGSREPGARMRQP